MGGGVGVAVGLGEGDGEPEATGVGVAPSGSGEGCGVTGAFVAAGAGGLTCVRATAADARTHPISSAAV